MLFNSGLCLFLRCKKMVPASKRYTIHRSSNVLTISLKRFASLSGAKINKEVKYPEYLDLRAYMSQSIGEPLLYALYAVLVHSGVSTHTGHYFCFIKAADGLWYQMNDATVVRSNIKTVLSQQAYVLFYIRRYDLTLGERTFYLPAPSYPRSFLGQKGTTSKQAGFIGPRLPPHMIKNSSRLNGSRSSKEDPNTVGVTLKRPSSAPPTACVQNWAITRPSITNPSKKQKITISIHNKLPARQTASQPDCRALEEEAELNKSVPSFTFTDSSAAESTSNASMLFANNVSKQDAMDEILFEPVLNGNLKLSSDNPVSYGTEPSGKSESSSLFTRNCNIISSNGILIGKVCTLQNSHSSYQNAEEERSQHELPTNDTLNGANSLDNEPKLNGLKLDDSSCQFPPAKPSEMLFSKTNGVLETMPIALSPDPQEMILDSFTYGQLNSLSEEISVPGPQESSENNSLMETVMMEALLVYEESRKLPSDLSLEAGNLFIQPDSETIFTKEEVAEGIITKADNAQPNINGQHKVRKRSLDIEGEFLDKKESEHCGNKLRRLKEPDLISKEIPLYIKGSPETEKELGQASSIKSDAECSSKKPACLDTADKCQDTKDISTNYVEVPPVNDSSITKLDKVLESQFSRENEGPTHRNCEENKHRKKDKYIYDSKKTDKEHYRRKREHSDTEEREKQNSKPDVHSLKRMCYHSVETNKQSRYKQEHCNANKYRSSYTGRNSPDVSRNSGKYYRSRSRGREQDRNRYYHSKRERTWSRERYYQDESWRWQKCRHYNDYYYSHARRDSRERKFSHYNKDFDRSSQAYSRSHKDYHYKSRRPHNSLSREEDLRHFSSHRTDSRHCSVPQQQQSGKYSHEGRVIPPVITHSNFEYSSPKNGKQSDRKKKYEESSESETERKSRKVEKEVLDDEKMKKYKKVKKKKKSKDKHREKDYKLYDSDFSVLHFDNDNRKRKKKKKKKKHIRKLKGFLEYLDPRFLKKTWEKEGSCSFADCLCEQYRNGRSIQPIIQPSKEGKPSCVSEIKN